MNAVFKSMSDLVADAEDLIARVAHSQTPEVRALSNVMQRSVDHMKEQLRRRARGLRPHQRVAPSWQGNLRIYFAVTASLALCIAAFLRRK
jgi:hypothetical protein